MVESSIAAFPHIVERATPCGTLRIHIPLSIPDSIQLQVDRVDGHGMNVPTSVVAGKNLVMQGEVVRKDGNKILVSHGGLLMHIESPDVKRFSDDDAGALVRTTITF